MRVDSSYNSTLPTCSFETVTCAPRAEHIPQALLQLAGVPSATHRCGACWKDLASRAFQLTPMCSNNLSIPVEHWIERPGLLARGGNSWWPVVLAKLAVM